MRADLRLGIDVGGTNTDAVVVDRADVLLAKAKAPTTPDVTAGIAAAIEAVLDGLGEGRDRITHAMLGTTHATNALLARDGLRRVAVLRIGGPATLAVPPLATFPADLRAAVAVGATVVAGGMEFDGTEIAPFDADATARFFDSVAGRAQAVAVTSVFPAVSDRHELAAEAIARAVLGDVHVSLSHEIGSIGLIERENATVLNAALVGVAHTVAHSFGDALEQHGLRPARYFAQNDGTLMELEYALRYPVLTIGCGPANSMRGAAHVSSLRDALVADVGGTSTEVGAMVNGFPGESNESVGIAGVRTNFRMPALVTLPLGGGTIVSGGDRPVRVGPQSVGYRLAESALVFGGSTQTLTDAAVAAGRVEVGHCAPHPRHHPALAQALACSDAMLAEAIDRAKVVPGDQPLVVVGGGGFLVPDDVPGVSEVHRPPDHEVANAIGAAIGLVSGQIERIARFGAGGRTAAIAEACESARLQAVRAGADPECTEIVDVEEVPLAYLTDPAVRIRVKAAGTLRFV
ncbi:hydantoinase/oxoprolinase N-terminal domain-containing protein [Pseudonocardia acidicola]|uniref:Hydantoinase/oxoprolinase family protein n=1 Tax=Pseudonocardia acidicola TaxID=2724939 RepID=A0ABX1SBD1_9PSEU|nr:hydantoinase/oxoprolinase family protein [Pseudonocardia acidicola]NMH97483.1 hydantoinase/oxoprolinase family protein [Pseudonocardia acidicola]